MDGSLLKPAQWKFLEEQAFTGFDNDANMVKIAILNLYLHQLETAHIAHPQSAHDRLRRRSIPGQLFDVILANPPFAGKVQEESILADLNYKLNTRATELLFLKWFIDHLDARRPRRCHRAQRRALRLQQGGDASCARLLLTECDLQAVISLPSGVFKPYSGVGTAVLIFQKGKPTESRLVLRPHRRRLQPRRQAHTESRPTTFPMSSPNGQAGGRPKQLPRAN